MELIDFKAYLDEKNTITIMSDRESSFTINGDFLHSYYAYKYNQYFVYKANLPIDINNEYEIKDDFGRTSKLFIRYFAKDDAFDEIFEDTNVPLQLKMFDDTYVYIFPMPQLVAVGQVCMCRTFRWAFSPAGNMPL